MSAIVATIYTSRESGGNTFAKTLTATVMANAKQEILQAIRDIKLNESATGKSLMEVDSNGFVDVHQIVAITLA